MGGSFCVKRQAICNWCDAAIGVDHAIITLRFIRAFDAPWPVMSFSESGGDIIERVARVPVQLIHAGTSFRQDVEQRVGRIL